MRVYAPSFLAALQAAQDNGIAPAYFVRVVARDRTTWAPVTYGFWTGDETITLAVENPEGGAPVLETFVGAVNLEVSGISYTADLTDNAVTVSLSQIEPTVQTMVRGTTVRLASCTIYGTSWAGGGLVSTPQILVIGIVDDQGTSTPEIYDDGAVTLAIRSELLGQLMISNPAKSSDSHQRRRQTGDRFSRYAGSLAAWRVQWFKN